jgi:hypothetical protein
VTVDARIRIGLRLGFVATVALASTVAHAAPVEFEIEDDDAPPEVVPPSTPSTTSTPSPTSPTSPTSTPSPPSTPSTPPEATPPDAAEPTATPEPAAVDVAALQAELAALQNRVVALESDRAVATSNRRPRDATKPPTTEGDLPPSSVGFGRVLTTDHWGLRFSGYMQVQYQYSQLSEDQLQQGGAALNRDRFAIRRGRARVNGDWRYFAFEFELDASTTRGPFIGVRQAHLDAIWRHRDRRRVPYIMASAGLTEVPFGYEVRLGQREMPFMERSVGSLAFFPGPVDVGLRLRGGVGPLRYDVAMMNGTPLDDRAGGPAGIDFNRRPDFAGRVGVEALPKRWSIGAGASFLAGRGFHPGTDATKNLLQWQDLNENGALDSGETVAIPGTAALPSENFRRWAVGVDVQLGLKTKIGWSRLLAEAAIATNLDRGLLVSDPVATGADLRQISAYAAIVQDATRWALVGIRYDLYDANADLLDARRGRFVPANTAIHTISPLVGAVLPAGVVRGFRGRLVLQYDASIDTLGRDARGVPNDLRNDQLTLRLQGEF